MNRQSPALRLKNKLGSQVLLAQSTILPFYQEKAAIDLPLKINTYSPPPPPPPAQISPVKNNKFLSVITKPSKQLKIKAQSRQQEAIDPLIQPPCVCVSRQGQQVRKYHELRSMRQDLSSLMLSTVGQEEQQQKNFTPINSLLHLHDHR